MKVILDTVPIININRTALTDICIFIKNGPNVVQTVVYIFDKASVIINCLMFNSELFSFPELKA